MENIELTGVSAADAGQLRADEGQVAAAEKPSWEAILADPEYNKRMQAIVSARVKEAKQAQDTLQLLQPALELLRKTYGAEDDAQLAAAITAPRDLREQALQLQQTLPQFDLDAAMKEPAFARLTALGVDVEDAYFASHRQSIIDAAVQQAALKLSNAVRAGSMRPTENGSGGFGASLTRFDYSQASKQQREQLKKAIRTAAARGERIFP